MALINNSELDNFLKLFIESNKQKELNKTTIKLQKNIIKKLIEFLKENKKNLNNKNDLIEFKNKLKENLKYTTINLQVTIINKFIKYVVPDEYNHLKLKKEKIQKTSSVIYNLTSNEIIRMINKANKQNKKDIAMIIKILSQTGIRVSELKFFTVDAITKGNITIRNKGKERTIPIKYNLNKEIIKYIKDNEIKSGLIFKMKTKDKPISQNIIYNELKKLAKKCKINAKKVYPHAFRHYFARIYLNAGGNVLRLQDLLGHSSLQTTHIYQKDTIQNQKQELNNINFLRN